MSLFEQYFLHILKLHISCYPGDTKMEFFFFLYESLRLVYFFHPDAHRVKVSESVDDFIQFLYMRFRGVFHYGIRASNIQKSSHLAYIDQIFRRDLRDADSGIRVMYKQILGLKSPERLPYWRRADIKHLAHLLLSKLCT